MRFILIFVIAAMAISAYLEAPERAAQAGRQERLDAEQRQVLVQLEGMHDKTVSQFVQDWREYRGAATAESLEELQLAAAKIRANPAEARGFTMASKEHKADAFNATFRSAVGTKMEAKPGL